MSQKMAVIKDVKFGLGDRDVVWMQFSAYTDDGLASLQILSIEQAVELIKKFEVSDVHMLNGKTVWVESDNHISRYVAGTGI